MALEQVRCSCATGRSGGRLADGAEARVLAEVGLGAIPLVQVLAQPRIGVLQLYALQTHHPITTVLVGRSLMAQPRFQGLQFITLH